MRASESDRALICPASLVLPRFDRGPGRAAEFGTLCHYWKETGSPDMPGADERDVKCLRKKLVLSGIEREDYWPSPGLHEVTFAIHLKRHALYAREYGDDQEDSTLTPDEWKKSFPLTFLTGTIDYLRRAEDGSGTAWLDDLKTGRWPVDPRTSKQLRSYALFPWVRAGCPDDYAINASITQWEKYPQHGLPKVTNHVLTGLDLSDHLEDLRFAVEHPEEVNPTEDGCRFCDCRPTCPARAHEYESCDGSAEAA